LWGCFESCGFGAHLTHLQAATQSCFSSLQLHQEATAALTQASSSVQAATVTVMGAKTLLADLEGVCALLSPGLWDVQCPSNYLTCLCQGRRGQSCVPKAPLRTSLMAVYLPMSHTAHWVLAHLATLPTHQWHHTTCRAPQNQVGRELMPLAVHAWCSPF
jgi:hypothetical protein